MSVSVGDDDGDKGVKGVEGVDVIKADEAGGDDVDVIEADEAGGDDVDDDASSIDSGVLPEDVATKDGVDPPADLEAVREKTIKECECELAGVDLELASQAIMSHWMGNCVGVGSTLLMDGYQAFMLLISNGASTGRYACPLYLGMRICIYIYIYIYV